MSWRWWLLASGLPGEKIQEEGISACVSVYLYIYIHTYVYSGEGNGNPLLPGESHGQSSLVGLVHSVAKSRAELSD